MSFKKGDRVTGQYRRGPGAERLEFTFVSLDPKGWGTATVRKEDGALTRVWADSLEAVAPPFKIGDRVQGLAAFSLHDVDERIEGVVTALFPKRLTRSDEILVRPADGNERYLKLETVSLVGFKPGDRVEYVGKSELYAEPEKIGKTGTVVSDAYHEVVEVEWDGSGSDRPSHSVYRDNVELIKPKPDAEPEKPALGDRVRVVHEGVVTEVDTLGNGQGFAIETTKGSWVYAGRATKSVEILERKATGPKPGTVAVSGEAVYVQLEANRVRAVYPGEDSITQVLRGVVTTFGDVVHEPPAS